jgi:hypothetical protein
LARRINEDEMDAWERWEMRTKFWSENLTGRDYSEDLGVDRKIILECILRKYGGEMWIGCVWLRIGTSGGLLWTRYWTFDLLASQERLGSVELVGWSVS